MSPSRTARAALAGGIAALAASLASGPASAGNWTLVGSATERIEASTNIQVEQDGDPAVGSVTGLDLELGYQTPRTDWALGSGLRFRQYVGPGGEEGLQGLTDPRIDGSVVHRGPRHVIQADVGFVRQPVAFAELEDLELVDRTADETRLRAGGSLSWLATPRTTLTVSTGADVRRFSEDSDEFAPSNSVQLSGGFSRRLDPRTQAGLTLGYRRFASDGLVTEVRSDVVSLSANADRRLTPRHTVGVSVGVANTWEDRVSAVAAANADRGGPSFQGSANFAYAGPRDTTLSIAASQSLQPTAAGELAQTTGIGVGLQRPLTSWASLLLSGDYTLRLSEDNFGDSERAQSFRLAAGLDFELTRVWTAGAGIDFRYLTENDGDAEALRMFLQVSRALVFNP